METPASSILLVFGGPVTPEDVPSLCERVCSLLAASDAELIVCDVAQVVEPDVAAVDALARLQVAAKRLGRRVSVCNATPEFRRLLAFMGLADVVPFRAPLTLEPRRQSPQREQRVGLEEERELPDAVA